ncbi:ribosome biogenesis protein BOP1 homolog [Schistocerca serialis cubense]|uniref:ribosome biogenesis protein BOP1 homolog n=1 Tax=Schistocerca serialis cubense TaxID=2023355 RepID=UPI00214F2FA6|nr:ribosome biogenesis protein BOP1 homolog [Schistocerca serialis cubense]
MGEKNSASKRKHVVEQVEDEGDSVGGQEEAEEKNFLTTITNEGDSSDEDYDSDLEAGTDQEDEFSDEDSEELSFEEEESDEEDSIRSGGNSSDDDDVDDDDYGSGDGESSDNGNAGENSEVVSSSGDAQGPSKSSSGSSVFEEKRTIRSSKTATSSKLGNLKKTKNAKKEFIKSKNAVEQLTVKESGENQKDEYETDSSDEEDIRNTVGNIPMNWYDDYPHIGYDWEGKKILKPPKGDELDTFLKKMEDPNFWRTVKDPQTGQDVVLCDADVDLIQRLQSSKIPDAEFDEYAPWIEWFTSEVMKTPLRKFPEHKRSFLPSKSEKEKVSKLVHAIKMGWIKPRKEKDKDPKFYMLWQTDDTAEHMRRIHDHIPAPKRHLPGHAESYNPPPEYLFDEREVKQWNKLQATPWKRKLHFIPQKYRSLREVPAYSRYIRERFLRCLDLYMCPRARKMRLTIQPEELVPQLPSPKDLQPFPTVMSLVYKGHTDMVRTIAVEPKGQFLASGSDDLTVKIWEVSTGRCVRTIPAGGIVRSVSWCPNQSLSLIAIAADKKVLLVNPGVGDHMIVNKTDNLLQDPPEQDILIPERIKSAVQWEKPSESDWKNGIRIILNHFKEVRQVTWHGRGDYFATVMPEGLNRSVLIHQLSKWRSQVPFSKSKGLVQCVLFHPIRPIFFVATQRNVRVYDLVKQELVKKLLSNSRWISSMAIHPGGDNVLVGTYDRKMLWFDLDLSTKPYQTLRLHGTAVRGVAYHRRYPLFASGSDDCSIIISHGMVYNDLLQNPLIVPLKRLSHHQSTNDFGVFDVVFHPSQPWIFSSGADATIRLYT